MCLLVVAFQHHPDSPLIVAANRDEFLARKATAMTVLSERAPRIIGGRDEVAGGTWLAINEHGVIAGLTNVPGARDPTKRSRGELPLLLARHQTAGTAIRAFESAVKPTDYSPAWILVGDRADLFFIDLAQGGEHPVTTRLSVGRYVLENSPLFESSPKTAMVRSSLAGIEALRGDALVARLSEVLRSHEIPAESTPSPASSFVRPVETLAPCVHAGPYGTRSSLVALVPPSPRKRPRLFSADGPPCVTPLVDSTRLWEECEPTMSRS